MSDEDDLFWQIALTQHGSNLHPSINDNGNNHVYDYGIRAEPHELTRFCQILTANKEYPGNKNPNISDVRTISRQTHFILYFQELLLDAGVMSTIGGEIWEASLLLCAYIVLNRDHMLYSLLNQCDCEPKNVEVLELGSGVGLPGLLVASLLQNWCMDTSNPHADINITLTDFDDSLLRNLCANGQLNGFDTDDGLLEPKEVSELVTDACATAAGGSCTLSVEYLNWFDYRNADTDIDSNVDGDSCSGKSRSAPCFPSQIRKKGAVDLIIGSALVYSPSHAAVVDVLKYFLSPTNNKDRIGSVCREVTIIQIEDRAGVDCFVERLKIAGLCWSIEEVPEECYRIASRGITIEKCDHVNNSNRSGKIQKLTIDISGVFNEADEFTEYRSSVIRTPRESFRLFRVWK